MSENMRRVLLEAAFRVLGKRGVGGLTLDAVAGEAGASKGGVLYHFKSKDALFEGLLGEAIGEFEREVEGEMGKEQGSRGPGSRGPGSRRKGSSGGGSGNGGKPGRFLRAYVRVSCREETEEEAEMGSALLAAVAADPKWARVYWPAVERWRKRAVEDGVDEATAMAVMAAADGMSICQSLGIGEGRKAMRRGMVERMLEWVEGGRIKDEG